MPRDKYKNNIAYWHTLTNVDGVPTPSAEGIPFYCNKDIKNTRVATPMAASYRTNSQDRLKTTSQLKFQEGDYITFTKTPKNDVDYADFSTIKEIEKKPYLEKGNKHRNKEYYEQWLIIS